MFQLKRRYPVGIQTFSRIREGGYVYVDKTDLMWQAQAMSPYIFLSRPRRFGKSLLTTTFKSFFEGRRDLFEGLKVMELETEWMEYPVIHLDLSMAKSMSTVERLEYTLKWMLRDYMEQWHVSGSDGTPGNLFSTLISEAYKQTGKQVVLLIDEYDAPLLDVLHTDEQLAAFRHVMQEFYQTLKASEAMIRFCFITGITKFSQLSIFSTLNNLMNISMLPQFSAICGITETELTTTLAPDIALLAEANEVTPEEMHSLLKKRYDGYHFSKQSEDIYNPYSLMKAFLSKELSNYWFDSGTPSYLIRQMQHFRTDITTMESIEASASAFDRPTEAMTDALPLLYQSGYLTIKGYDKVVESYTLSIPNQEVRVGFTEGLIPTYLGLGTESVRQGFAIRFYRALRSNDLDLALREMQAYIASLPYIEGFKKKLDDVAKAEGFYEWTFYLIFSMLNAYVRTQVKTIRGRADIVVRMPDATYVFELKINGTAHEALQQINSQGYAIPYQTDGLPIYKVGIRFSTETLSIEEWEIGV
ncbi:MAG: ATP-binding protein [Bacteroidaceae bacterium]|nr:ATP-binding protein [Bacteroidaceae bacterium]